MRWSLVFSLFVGLAYAADKTTDQTTTSSADSTDSTDSSLALTGGTTITNPSAVAVPTGEYESYTSTITLDDGKTTSTFVLNATITGNSTATPTGNQTTVTTTHSNSLTVLVGASPTNGTNSTATSSTSTAALATNTQVCNSYVEYCQRSYSNITMIAAHNSPFVRQGNAAANQEYSVTDQLNDGIRMLQFQVHNQNGTMYLCHTSCELLNVGTLQAYLTTVFAWMLKNPFDVVTFLIGNYDYVDPGNFTAPIQNSGLMDLIYTPSKIPMVLEDWPTLSEMILKRQRAVFFMDYQANQTAYPWLMDEFSQMWETPFSPTDRDFPCTEQRPPNLSVKDAKNRMYMANHNLNLELNLGSISLMIPNTAVMNVSNAVSGYGSLGLMAENCTATWDRPPNFLLVDFYNYGNFNGSVFEVAANMNNVTFNNQTCCGVASAAMHSLTVTSLSTLFIFAAGVQVLSSFI
ncbi:PLC-like phosphodiesterase [Penicillium taxi]|uniref:PLC-like phosphodiesterase n=1 Tax=Penicillium taxi TaxID=168475 RepID=UPI00254538AA|nr:PLC-like phosphodiesterase [Penicillium taxi]KAJ5893880.1 PLC-like phosphodiesterase [Penicillium taxi]